MVKPQQQALLPRLPPVCRPPPNTQNVRASFLPLMPIFLPRHSSPDLISNVRLGYHAFEHCLHSLCIDSLLDPGDFASRYLAHIKGVSILSIEGQLLAKVLVVWAASFGVDEFGVEIPPCSSADIITNWRLDARSDDTERRVRRERTDTMTHELLRLVDLHGILRKPTWDGVRVLLLVWPLTAGVQTTLQRIVSFLTDALYSVCSFCNPTDHV
jgi:hypothetical protein